MDTPSANTLPAAAQTLARKLAAFFAQLPQVEAVALAGSQTGPTPDALSDIDLYVYTHGEIDLETRKAIVARSGGASRANLGLAYWGSSDGWFDAVTGIEVDVMYFDTTWMADQLNRVLIEHQASLGYSTAFAYTVHHSHLLHDPNGWLQALQRLTRQPYPEALRRNIVAFNHPVLRTLIPAYTTQLAKAAQRRDLVSINHRLAALLASYFDIVFAANRVLHPGEKQLVARMQALCNRLPAHAAEDIDAVLRASVALGPEFPELMGLLNQLLDRLDNWLEEMGFDLRAMQSAASEWTWDKNTEQDTGNHRG